MLIMIMIIIMITIIILILLIIIIMRIHIKMIMILIILIMMMVMVITTAARRSGERARGRREQTAPYIQVCFGCGRVAYVYRYTSDAAHSICKYAVDAAVAYTNVFRMRLRSKYTQHNRTLICMFIITDTFNQQQMLLVCALHHVSYCSLISSTLEQTTHHNTTQHNTTHVDTIQYSMSRVFV